MPGQTREVETSVSMGSWAVLVRLERPLAHGGLVACLWSLYGRLTLTGWLLPRPTYGKYRRATNLLGGMSQLCANGCKCGSATPGRLSHSILGFLWDIYRDK